MLKGKKVILRPVKKSDIPLFLQWLNDPEVVQYLARYLPLTEVEEKEWIERVSREQVNGQVIFVIEDKTKKPTKPIGNCGLRNINWKDRVAEFGIVIGEKDYWSKGFGTETAKLLIDYGFNQLNLRRISSTAYEFNKRSIGLHKKLGFKEEGRRRKARFKNGKFWDEVVFGLLKKEWRP